MRSSLQLTNEMSVWPNADDKFAATVEQE